MTSSQGEPPLTRRQLREMERAQAAAAGTPETPVEDAPAPVAPQPPAPVQTAVPVQPTVPAQPAPSEQSAPSGQAAAPAQPSSDDALNRHSRRAAPTEPDAAPTASASAIPAPPAPADAATSEPSTATGSRTLQPPTGHWSIAANAPEDPDEQGATPLSRNVLTSGTVTATNALILPNIPSAADATAPLTSTGEILVTGSIDLPRSLGSTGHQPHGFDSADMDRMYEQAESERPSTDATPIRAASAISATASTTAPISPPKNRGTRLPTILSITAGVLAVAVLGLLAAGYFFKVF
jgi:hypothetical protein